jgi:hypothetical protein
MNVEEYRSFDWSNAQWILAIVIGIVMAKYYSLIVQYYRRREVITFYLPHFLQIGAVVLGLYLLWYMGEHNYSALEDKPIGFMLRNLFDGLTLLMCLYLIPDDTDLNTTEFDMKAWYMKTKNTFYVFLIVGGQLIFFLMAKYQYGFDLARSDFKFSIVMLTITTLLSIGVILSRNTYYHCFFSSTE